jgi:hypothetical protein
MPAQDAEPAEAAVNCGSTPTLLVSSDNLLPANSGPVGVTGWFGIHETMLFYEALGLRPGGNIGAIMSLPRAAEAPTPITGFFGQPSGSLSFTPNAPTKILFGVGPNAGFGGDAQRFGQIATVALDGTSLSILASTNGLPAGPISDGKSVFYIDGARVQSVPLAGGSIDLVADQAGMSLALWGENLILDDFGGNQILRVPTAGGAVEALADNQMGPQLVQNCGADICWMNIGDPSGMSGILGSLMRLSTSGSLTKIAPLANPHGFAYDGVNFFATATNSLLRIKSADGSITPLANMSAMGDVAVDESCVYWFSVGGIYSLSKSAALGP